MAPKKKPGQRNGAQVKAGLGPKKQQRVARAAKRKDSGFPWLAGVVGGLLVVGAVVLLVVAWRAAHPTVDGHQAASLTGATVSGVKCESAEQSVVHYHAHLDMVGPEGNKMTVPAQIGYGAANTCLYWLHTHDATGLIHIEAPASAKARVFTLGDLFSVWGQPLDTGHLAALTLAPGETLTAYVDGVKWPGTLKSVPLKAHGQITLVITSGSGPVPSPDPYTFPSGT